MLNNISLWNPIGKVLGKKSLKAYTNVVQFSWFHTFKGTEREKTQEIKLLDLLEVVGVKGRWHSSDARPWTTQPSVNPLAWVVFAVMSHKKQVLTLGAAHNPVVSLLKHVAQEGASV